MLEKSNAIRDVLYSIARYCTLTAGQMSRVFEQESIYPSGKDWHLFLERFLLALSALLLASGVVFFFAYNWAEMHKFVKLGMLQAILVIIVGLALFSPFERRVKEALLCGAAVVMGVLFAVYGQIYQTGADAYDFFQGWALGVFLWALAARSSYLWFLFLLLLNLTLYFYAEQVARISWSGQQLPMLLFLMNAAAVVMWEYLYTKGQLSASSRWFPLLVGLGAIIINTLGMGEAILNHFRDNRGLIVLLTIVFYGTGFWYGLRYHRMFYPAALGLSLIIMGTVLLVRVLDKSGGEAMLLFSSLFVIGATTALAYYLRQLNKLWYGNN